jgi:type II secretory pathway pseudopilin PulG
MDSSQNLTMNLHYRTHSRDSWPGFTLVELLVAISITLLIMATVVQVFTSVSDSVQKRRSMVEVSNQLRHVRNQLQSDLKGATCPTIPWTRPESNVGYFEVIEGPYSDFNPSLLTDGLGTHTDSAVPEIDHTTSTIPTSNVDHAIDTNMGWVTDGRGLGDHDDILAFTTRNESSPFRGRAPSFNTETDGTPRAYSEWDVQSIESPVAEVVWYAVEAPIDDPRYPDVETRAHFGEPGYRTIYRRVLLVAPWLDYAYRDYAGVQRSRPGVLRILDPRVSFDDVHLALAALITFQERYDISARIEWDPTLMEGNGSWTIVANTLADLTKRENRYEHHGIHSLMGSDVQRRYPFPMASGGGRDVPLNPTFVADPEFGVLAGGAPDVVTHSIDDGVSSFEVRSPGSGTIVRPLVMLNGQAIARAILNERGRLVHVTTGLAPLGKIGVKESRRGDDVMLTQALAFDVQVFDPHAPLYALGANGRPLVASDLQGRNRQQVAAIDATLVGPGDEGWAIAAARDGLPVNTGAYVDLGYVFRHYRNQGAVFPLPSNREHPLNKSSFAGKMNAIRSRLPEHYNSLELGLESTLYRTWCTWSHHYETNGINEDHDYDPDRLVDGQPVPLIDEGTNGVDDYGLYDLDGDGDYTDRLKLFGPDDMGERETAPPYAAPLRGVQVSLRVYEPDSRQMREVTVRQNFVSE